jgi:hypothetical protein
MPADIRVVIKVLLDTLRSGDRAGFPLPKTPRIVASRELGRNRD